MYKIATKSRSLRNERKWYRDVDTLGSIQQIKQPPLNYIKTHQLNPMICPSTIEVI